MSKESQAQLRRLSPDGREREAYTILDKERLIAFSYLKPVIDKYGREGFWNHTILVPIIDYIESSKAIEKFRPFFIKNMKNPVQPLKPIVM